MIGRFLGAVQFLTTIPVMRSTSSPGDAAPFFPLIGAILGAIAGAILQAVTPLFGPSLAALMSLTTLLALTGCLHEDGLADVADAVRAGRTREKMLAILKDSRIGTYGAIALILSVALRWQSLSRITVPLVPGLAAALTLSRTSLVVMAVLTPSIGTGLGRAFADSCSRPVLFATVAQAIAIASLMAVFIGWRYALALFVASAATILLSRFYFMRRVGGTTGDCLGATCQAVEIINLLALTWRPSI